MSGKQRGYAFDVDAWVQLHLLVDIADADPYFSPARLSDAERAHVDAVLEVYADFSGDQLEEMTHREAPWAGCARKRFCIFSQ